MNRHAGILLALLVGLSTALALLAGQQLIAGPAAGRSTTQPEMAQHMAGSHACASCHAAESAAWASSQHALAMQHADSRSVRGDFSGAEADYFGTRSRFFTKDGKYWVTTDGPDGKPATFEVKYTFGIEPLQQYLVELPGGRIQALPFAWDTRPKKDGGQRWFHLYPDEHIGQDDILHWTKLSQNWNHMCAECHSTAVRKNYDAATDTFSTTFSEISVGCEACHGPAHEHVAWAEKGADPATPRKGFAATAAKRPAPDWSIDPNTGSPAHGVTRPAGDEVETCARCHGRRSALSENWMPGHPITDTHLPALLSSDLFEDDGQMRDEVFNDHTFKQSLMYAKGVICTDCHDPHTGRLIASGAAVCSQCHAAERFESVRHTGHAPGAAAPDCIACHMPARTYMGVDKRHDHSFRIPRPDVSVKLGTPNACNDCHTDKSPIWAADAVLRWHGPHRKGHQTWAEAFHTARQGDPAARELLLKLAADPQVPAIARATALSEAQQFPSSATSKAALNALSDADPMVRIVALRALAGAPLEHRWQLAAPLLSDPVAAVRMEAGLLLADQPLNALGEADRDRLTRAMAEFEKAQRLNADRPEARANLANYFVSRGDPAAAEAELRAGLRLHPAATTLSVNLADLYRALGREADAERTLREAIALAPQSGAAYHALGLSLVRQKRYDEALEALQKAMQLDPGQPRYAYVYAVALQSTGKPDLARKVIDEALRQHPYDIGLLQIALEDVMRRAQTSDAAALAHRLSQMLPDDAGLAQLSNRLSAK